MPLAIKKTDITSIVSILRMAERHAGDREVEAEAKRLADMLERQIDPLAIVVTG